MSDLLLGVGIARVARQQWRAWIETNMQWQTKADAKGESPASNGGRGLKLTDLRFDNEADRVARQQWRAWIETHSVQLSHAGAYESPASNGGRGLKHAGQAVDNCLRCESPASNGGRGLKLSHLQSRPTMPA